MEETGTLLQWRRSVSGHPVREYSEKCAKVHTQAIFWCVRRVNSGSGLEVTWYFSLHFVFRILNSACIFF